MDKLIIFSLLQMTFMLLNALLTSLISLLLSALVVLISRKNKNLDAFSFDEGDKRLFYFRQSCILRELLSAHLVQ